MSKQTLGKTLLRNVIRHTDAHNKIQEEMEMWKMRDMEIQTSQSDPEFGRGRMHCNRVSHPPRDWSRSRDQVSEHDDREARYWTRKLYDFESKDPDRWGHSGFKELYPEEFESDGEKSNTMKKSGRHKIKKSKSDTEACLSKRSKKSSRKKKKKKKKKGEEGKHKRAVSSSSDSSSDDSGDKPRRKRTKSRHKNKKSVKTRGRDEDSSSEDSGERRTHRKRKQDSQKDSDSDSKKKRRKNWKAAGEASSDDSSAD